jgi:predicted alpha/beta-hydrolase family hydrolase
MDTMAELLAQQGIGVVRFEFPYMVERRENGKKRPPNKQDVLLDTWREVIAELGGASQLVIGGKSMGGRMASLIADEQQMAGLVCLGYPFHPPGKPEKLRTEHLKDLHTPTLIVQGTRDKLGNREEVEDYELSSAIELLWLEDGDHDLKPRVKSGFTHDQHLQLAAEKMAEFVRERTGK